MDESYLDRKIPCGSIAGRLQVEAEQRTFGPGHVSEAMWRLCHSRCDRSLNPRKIQCGPTTTIDEMAALSEPMKAKGRDPVAIARTAPMVPP